VKLKIHLKVNYWTIRRLQSHDYLHD